MGLGAKLLLELVLNLRFDRNVRTKGSYKTYSNGMEFIAVKLGFEVRNFLNSCAAAWSQTKRMS